MSSEEAPNTLFAGGALLWTASVWLLVPLSLLPAAKGEHRPGAALTAALLFLLCTGLGARARFRLHPKGPGIALERAAYALAALLFLGLGITLRGNVAFLETPLGVSLCVALVVTCGLLAWEALSALARRYGRALLASGLLLALGSLYALNALAQIASGAPILGAGS